MPTNALSYATFTTDENLIDGGGSLTGTLNGTATVTGSRLDITGAVSAYCDFVATGNADTQQAFAIKFKYTPNYSGSAVPEQDVVLVGNHGSLVNLIRLRHSGAALVLHMFDQTGASLSSTSIGAFSPTALQTYEFELNIDLTTGASRLFIDGVQLGSTVTTTGTRSSAITLWRFGDTYTGGEVSDCFIEDPVFFSTVQHTANYTAGYTLVENRYPLTYQSARFNTTVDTDGMISLAETGEVIPTGDSLTYVVESNGVDRWYNAVDSEWQVSSGGLQSNTVADFNTNIAALALLSGAGVTITMYMKSNDGSTTPEIVSNDLVYSFFEHPIICELCVLYGYMYFNCVADEGTISVKTSPNVQTKNANFYAVDELITARSSGYFEFSVPRGAVIDFKMAINDTKKTDGTITVPTTASAALDVLAT